MTELEIYKEALGDYRWSLFLPKRVFNTQSGFCYYFMRSQRKEFRWEDCPTLFKLKPNKTYDASHWFKPGKILPRIKLLKKAIKLCQNTYE